MMGFGLIWIVLIAGIVAYALGWRPDFLEQRRPPGTTQKAPMDILKERYARGEITRQEFEEMRQDLEE